MESTGAEPALQATAQAPPQPAAPDWQRWAELGLVVLIAIVPLVLLAVSRLLYPLANPSGANFGIASGVLHEISSLLLLVYVLHRQGRNLRSIGLDFRWADIFRGLGLMIGGLLGSGFLRVLIRSIALASGVNGDVRDPHVIFGGISLSAMLVYLITSSIFEETIVRAYVTTELISLSYPVWLATAASVLLQTSYHVYYGLAGALGLSGGFIVFGLYFARSRRLMPLILGHVFVDVIASLLLFVR